MSGCGLDLICVSLGYASLPRAAGEGLRDLGQSKSQWLTPNSKSENIDFAT